MDKNWLNNLFQEVGLEADQAQAAAKQAALRMISRRPLVARKRSSLLSHMVRDPLRSLTRIVGQGAASLPFVEEETEALSAAAFSDIFGDAGLDPVVAMAFAKVMVEAYGPADIYQPLWEALGHTGEVQLSELRKLDWAPIRELFPELVEQVRGPRASQKPRAQPPRPRGNARGRPDRTDRPERPDRPERQGRPSSSLASDQMKTTPMTRARPPKKKP